MGATVTDRWPELYDKIMIAEDAALGMMAMDIERIAKQRVPVDQGLLLKSGGHARKGMAHFVVTFDKEYALYQEMGVRADGSHEVKNYTKSGTGAHYLGDAGKLIVSQAPAYFRATQAAVNL